jgi:hypothetical protein
MRLNMYLIFATSVVYLSVQCGCYVLWNWSCFTELLGLFWTLSIVLYVEDKKYHNVSETRSVSVLR